MWFERNVNLMICTQFPKEVDSSGVLGVPQVVIFLLQTAATLMRKQHGWTSHPLAMAMILPREYPYNILPYMDLYGTNVPTHFRILQFQLRP